MISNRGHLCSHRRPGGSRLPARSLYTTLWNTAVQWMTLLLLGICVALIGASPPDHIDKRFEPRTADQCFGQTIPIRCDPGQMVQVTKVFYRQSQQCRGSFHSNFCTREEASNPACVGNETCVFTTPYIYLSPECGYSNNFLVTYKCIPVNLPRDVCEEGTLSAASGYVVSPSYPSKYPAGKNCKVTITTPPGTVIQVYLIDLYLAYYNYDVTKQCVDTLWIVGQGEKDRTGYLCSGKQRGLVFTSQSNKITIYFTSKGHRFLNAKGFWLFFQAVVRATPRPRLAPTLAPGLNKAITSQPELQFHNTDTVHSLRPTEPPSTTKPTRIYTKPAAQNERTTKTEHISTLRPVKKEKLESKHKMASQKYPNSERGYTAKKEPTNYPEPKMVREYMTKRVSRKPTTKAITKDRAVRKTMREKPTTQAITSTTTKMTTIQTTLPTTHLPTTYYIDYTEVHHGPTYEPEISSTIPVFEMSTILSKPPQRYEIPKTTHSSDNKETVVQEVNTTPMPTGSIFDAISTMIPKTSTELMKTSIRISVPDTTLDMETPSTTTKVTTSTVTTTSVSPLTSTKQAIEKLPKNNTLSKAKSDQIDNKIDKNDGLKNDTTDKASNGTAAIQPVKLDVAHNSKSRLKVPLWAKEPPSQQAAVFFRKISDTTRKGIVGGAGGFLVLMLVVTVLVILFKRRQSNKNCTPPPMLPSSKPENYADIILAYGSNDTTKGFVNVGFENESIHEYPMDSCSQSGSFSNWGGTLGSNRGLNSIDEGPEIVYMDAKTAMGTSSLADKKKKRAGNKVRWVKSKSLDDIRHTIRYTQKQMTRASLKPTKRLEDSADKEPFSVSLGWLDDDANGSSGDFNGSLGSFICEPGGRLQAHLAAGKQYHTMANLNTESCLAQSETTLYSNPSTTETTASLNFMSMDKIEASPYETVHFQHQDEVAL